MHCKNARMLHQYLELADRDALGGRVSKHALHEVDAVGAEGGEVLVEVLLAPVGELVPVAQLGHASPLRLCGRAQQLEDVQQLLQLAVPGEQWHLRIVLRLKSSAYAHSLGDPSHPFDARHSSACIPWGLSEAHRCGSQQKENRKSFVCSYSVPCAVWRACSG